MANLTFTPVPEAEIARRMRKALTPDEHRWCDWLDTIPQRTAYEEQHISLAAFVAGSEKERAACAELVRAAGCVCADLRQGRFLMLTAEREAFARGETVHDCRCPMALAAAIEASKEE